MDTEEAYCEPACSGKAIRRFEYKCGKNCQKILQGKKISVPLQSQFERNSYEAQE